MTKEEIDKRIEEIEKKGYKYHHSATKKGYVRKELGRVDEYYGRFGEGYIVELPNSATTISNGYHHVYYYVKQ